jgi:mannosyltransferase
VQNPLTRGDRPPAPDETGPGTGPPPDPATGPRPPHGPDRTGPRLAPPPDAGDGTGVGAARPADASDGTGVGAVPPAGAAERGRPGPAADGAAADRARWRWPGLVRRVPVWWLVPAAVTAAIVAHHAARPQLWRDEFATWQAATRTVPQIVALGHHIDAVTVPYYVFMHYWIARFGDSVLALRTPSIIAMTATAAVVAALGRRLYGAKAGLLGGLLVAVVPVVSRYAQEARAYSFAALFAAVATYLLVVALQRSRWYAWVGYAAAVLLLGLSHQVALLLLAAHLVAVVVECRREHRLRALWWLLAVGVALAGLLPVALLGLGEQGTQLSWLSAARPIDLAQLPERLFGAAAIGGAVCALAAVGLARGDRWGRTLWLSALLPIALLFLADQYVTPIFLGRYLVFATPLLCLLAGRALAGVRWWLAGVVVLVVALLGYPEQQSMRRSHSPFDYAGAAAVVRAGQRPGDGIVYAPRGGWQFTDEAFRYLLRGAVPRDVLLYRDEAQRASLWATECPDPAPCLRGTPRVWTVSADNLETHRTAGATDQLPPAVLAALRAGYRQGPKWRVDGFTIVLFTRRSG